MKYGRIEEWRQQYPVALMCRVFDVSESGFHAWRDRPLSAPAQENARLEVEIRAALHRTREICGPERLQSDLVDLGIRVGVERIKRIRKKLGLAANRNGNSGCPLIPNITCRWCQIRWNGTLPYRHLTGRG